jgi:hypothetical protein
MPKRDLFPGLEAIVAHGARMSWMGLLRPGDPFPLARRCRRAVLRAEGEEPLRRGFGTWSKRYRRYTTQLSSPLVSVTPIEPGQSAPDGVQVLLHWVSRAAFEGTGAGTVCAGDGWPASLWERFLADPERDPSLPLATALRRFRVGSATSDAPVVVAWRAALSNDRSALAAEVGTSLVPVPARLVLPDGDSDCILSWCPGAPLFPSLRTALDAPAPGATVPDLAAQARYYLECTLAAQHGVEFGPSDCVRDAEFERSSAYRALAPDLVEAEWRSIADRGRLDALG